MNIEFSDDEIKILAEIIEQSFDDLRVEIRHTDNHDYKERLKQKEKTFELLLQKLKSK
jgi:hypothetical protein